MRELRLFGGGQGTTGNGTGNVAKLRNPLALLLIPHRREPTGSQSRTAENPLGKKPLREAALDSEKFLSVESDADLHTITSLLDGVVFNHHSADPWRRGTLAPSAFSEHEKGSTRQTEERHERDFISGRLPGKAEQFPPCHDSPAKCPKDDDEPFRIDAEGKTYCLHRLQERQGREVDRQDGRFQSWTLEQSQVNLIEPLGISHREGVGGLRCEVEPRDCQLSSRLGVAVDMARRRYEARRQSEGGAKTYRLSKVVVVTLTRNLPGPACDHREMDANGIADLHDGGDSRTPSPLSSYSQNIGAPMPLQNQRLGVGATTESPA